MRSHAAEATARIGSSKHCVNCGAHFGRFLPYREGTAGLSDFLVHAGYETGDLDAYGCPVCGIGDRERHLILYFDALGMWRQAEGADVLHFAPEISLRTRLSAIAASYTPADLFPSDDGVIAMDVTAIDASDGSFDLVVCNHVLEHVGDPAAALSEIARVLRPGGTAVLQLPYAARLEHTFSDPAIESPTERRFFYGQEDHVRLFGNDVFDLMRAAGLEVERIEHANALPDTDAIVEGVSAREALTLTHRPGGMNGAGSC